MRDFLNPLAMIQRDICGGIDMGASYDCDEPIAPGVDQRLILINRDDIDTVTLEGVIDNLITDITLFDTLQGYAFNGVRQSLQPSYEFIPQTVSVGYDHIVNFLAFDISQEQKNNLQKMALSKMVAIVENLKNPGNANSIFEVYGLGVGLEVITNVRIAADLETAGAFSIQLKTSDNEGKEPKMPASWFDVDYDTTKALVDAILLPAGP